MAECVHALSVLCPRALETIIVTLCRNGHLGDHRWSGRPPAYIEFIMEPVSIGMVGDCRGKLMEQFLVQL